jgi:hypothetical protein
MSRGPSRWVAAFSGGLVGLFAGLAVLDTPAAADPPACMSASSGGGDDYRHVQAEERGTSYSSLHGVRSNVLVSSSASCQRVSSVYVFSGTRNSVFEFGIVHGYSSCTDQVYSTPRPFAVWDTGSTATGCRVFEQRTPVPGNLESIRGSDVDQNTYWGSWYKGDELQPSGVNLDFSAGPGGVNVENGHPSDNGYARFDDVQEYLSAWSNFDSISAYVDISPGYHMEFPNVFTMRVVQD